ncbi:ketopantoate reductase family protein [Methylococcus capsulatus]|jgi:2-dehydropantoate 2-reductase|uniref:2-dehydropantoate 2-reductase n=1 Tax=Methylococcus capsulatus (strain ATCC 33009 / NCIMB 11132 / Bath) TaxID=243233 RepID=Q604L6_METCA|nr:2-dehydropantoate 2-reductase [Methylococcus capsulatus]AAU91321.1 2-dehydropantoate 2-reductase [Methylococcus capsulatus str. Bath]QXP91742.1 2-dehydropantoate 2-reductase [Methylococcus capsulatus]
MNILVIGTGAIGSFYGALLAKTGHCVSVVSRSDYETVKAKGIRIRSATLGDYTFRPAAVVRSAAELETKPDCTLLCIKVVEGADRVGLLRDAVAPDTGIVLISNGIDIEPEVAAAFPDNEVISGLAFIGVTRTAPGEIWHQAYGRLMLGNYPGGVSERVKTLAAAFEEAGIDGIATENITTARWQKCVWNAAFNPLSVLSGGLDTLDILSTQEGFVRAIMQEIRAVAAANGHPLPEDIVEKNVASTYKMPPYKTSMLVDFEAGQPMETEVILGNAVRAGRRTRVAIPHLESVYALMKLLELRTSKSLWGNPP